MSTAGILGNGTPPIMWIKSPKVYSVYVPDDSWEDIFIENYDQDGNPRPYLKHEVVEWCRDHLMEDPTYGGIYRTDPYVTIHNSYDEETHIEFHASVDFMKEIDAIHFKLRWIG